MYTSLSIKNFRAFQSLEIEGLKRVNLFTGRNNSGKTSVLEAVYLLEGETPAPRARQLFRNRGLADAGIVHQSALDMPWATLFRNLAVDTDIEISGLADGENRGASLTTRLDKAGRHAMNDDRKFVAIERLRNMLIGTRTPVPANAVRENWIGITSDRNENVGGEGIELNPGSFLLSGARRNQRELVIEFGAFEVEKKDVLVVEALRIVEPRLRGLSTILSGGSPLLHADLEGSERRLPLAVVGDGMLRLLDIVFAILQNRGHSVMIDEVENGFHYTVLPMVWKLIFRLAAEYDVQVFAVTHSQECAAAAHWAALEREEYDYRYFRVEQKNGVGRAVAYSREQMQTSIESELEFR